MDSKSITLSDRKQELILSVVEDYIETALPITSQKVHKNLFTSLSSATLRNELSSLEQMGFLRQLHTSGGRVPTTSAYRYYVDHLLSTNKINLKTVKQVEDNFITRSAFLIDMVNNVAKSLSEITKLPTFIHVSGFKQLKLLGVNIIPLITGQGLILLKTDAGVISNTIDLKKDVTEEHCKDASKFLTTNLYNKTINDVIKNIDDYKVLLNNQIKFYQDLFSALVNILQDYFSEDSRLIKNIDTRALFKEPEYQNIDNAKKFLEIIDDESEIKQIIKNINNNTENDIVFSIGEENENSELNDYSIISANYTLASGIKASIGVVGMKRMDYAKIASALKYVVEETKKLNPNNDSKQ